MAKHGAREARLQRIGRTAYKEIVVPSRQSPQPKFKIRAHDPTKTFEGIEFAREPLSSREHYRSIGSRSRLTAVQHIVVERWEEANQRAPWRYYVTTRCNARLNRAAVKAGRQFIELDVCEKCLKVTG